MLQRFQSKENDSAKRFKSPHRIGPNNPGADVTTAFGLVMLNVLESQMCNTEENEGRRRCDSSLGMDSGGGCGALLCCADIGCGSFTLDIRGDTLEAQ
jgi:hypothetical protein